MNVWRVAKFVALEPNASTGRAHTNVCVVKATAEIPSMEFAHPIKSGAKLTPTVLPTRNVFSQASACAHLPSSPMATSARVSLSHFLFLQLTDFSPQVHARDSHVVSMPNAHHRTHRSACVKLDLLETRCKVVSTLMSVEIILAPMVLTASMRREASSAFAQREWKETLTEEDVSAIFES